LTKDRLLRDILDALPVPALEIGPAGEVIHVPHNLTFPAPILQSANLLDVIDAEDRAAVSGVLQALPETLKAMLEVRVQSDAQEEAYALLSLGYNAGEPTPTILAQFTDITTQRQREKEIALRESRWNSALISSVSGVWDQNFTTGEMYGSEIWRSIRGMTVEDQIESNFESWVELLHPDDREHALHCITRQNAGDPAYAVFQYREKHKDGHWVWIECRGACIEWDENGKPVRIVGTDTDVSERKATEQEMQRISRYLKLALDASQVGVFEVDFDAGITVWDDRMYQIFGIDRNTPITVGGLWETLVHPADIERMEKNVEDKVNKLQPFSEDYRAVMPDGSVRYIRARSVPFIDFDGRRKMIGVNWDVTADVSLRHELERAKTLAEARNRELESAKNSIEHNAMHDYLTELPNRRYLDEMLERMAAEGKRNGAGIGILHIDLDRFKQINDTLGHRTGDVMLKHVAELLRKNIRAGDFVARIGGDEFVFVSRFTGSMRKLAALADRLIKELRKPVFYEGHDCRFGASIGIACALGHDIDYKQILLNADIALYNAKKRGRNRYEFFTSDKQDLLINTKRVSDEILLALERDEFVPYYQFQFDAKTLDISGVETLARWNHPAEGILTPDRFLAVAEDLDAVAAIDAVILEKALVDFETWQRAGLPIPKVSVNVSARRLHDPALTKTLNSLQIQPGTVSFELLESIFLDDNDDIAISNLQRLRDLGIDIEIDDFGTGHASIISLLKVNPSALKVDRELVRLAPQSMEQRKLLGSIIDIGHSLGIKVVAEGVETADHIGILQALACDSLQGYALCRPLPRDRVEAFVLNQSWRSASTQTQDHARSKVANLTVLK
jgi:diguanylate cyclase (GGDEF)-like protein/PAS domain S-box-containing protein